MFSEVGAEPTKKTALDDLAYAVAMQETRNCTEGWGLTHKNCMGVKKYRDGKLQPARYESKEAAYKDFKEIWSRMYKTEVPTMANAVKWSGGDRAEAWHENVIWFMYHRVI